MPNSNPQRAHEDSFARRTPRVRGDDGPIGHGKTASTKCSGRFASHGCADHLVPVSDLTTPLTPALAFSAATRLAAVSDCFQVS